MSTISAIGLTCVLVALVGVLMTLTWQTWTVRIDVAGAPGAPVASIAAQLLRDLSPAGYSLAVDGPRGVTFTRRFRPWWLIVLAVLLLPIGLLLLFFRRTHTISVMESERGPVVVGRGTRWARELCEAAARSGTRAGSVPVAASRSAQISAG